MPEHSVEIAHLAAEEDEPACVTLTCSCGWLQDVKHGDSASAQRVAQASALFLSKSHLKETA